MDPLVDHEQRLLALEKNLKDLQSRARGTAWGVWTPAFFGDGGTPGTFTYVAQVGRYTRIGSLCILQGIVAISAITVAPTGNMRIANLPFTVNSVINGGAYFTYIGGFNYSATAIELTGSIGASGNTITLYEAFDNAGAVAVPAANFTNPSCNLQFVGFYLV